MSSFSGLSAATDQEVVELARKGKEVAYRELLRRYQRPVFSLIYRMVRDRELAEDLAQETFVKVLNALDRYRPEYKFSSWVFKISFHRLGSYPGDFNSISQTLQTSIAYFDCNLSKSGRHKKHKSYISR
jgi:RNA polymerase sigma factor (sigma-70 family)